jgi:hypothetical protein
MSSCASSFLTCEVVEAQREVARSKFACFALGFFKRAVAQHARSEVQLPRLELCYALAMPLDDLNLPNPAGT